MEILAALPEDQAKARALWDRALADDGPGFDMRYVDKIFLPFERLHRDEIAGTGIGLANVRRVVELHGGVVRADSPPGEGARILFTLG